MTMSPEVNCELIDDYGGAYIIFTIYRACLSYSLGKRLLNFYSCQSIQSSNTDDLSLYYLLSYVFLFLYFPSTVVFWCTTEINFVYLVVHLTAEHDFIVIHWTNLIHNTIQNYPMSCSRCISCGSEIDIIENGMIGGMDSSLL